MHTVLVNYDSSDALIVLRERNRNNASVQNLEHLKQQTTDVLHCIHVMGVHVMTFSNLTSIPIPQPWKAIQFVSLQE
jgi:hypothetical protein